MNFVEPVAMLDWNVQIGLKLKLWCALIVFIILNASRTK